MKFTPEQLISLAGMPLPELRSTGADKAYAFVKQLSVEHYENFPVGSLLIPKSKRSHVFAIYAFARLADDIADELVSIPIEIRLNALAEMDKALHFNNEQITELQNPVFTALRQTMQEENLPAEPFSKLLEAFRRDILFKQPDTFNDIIDYCSCSANPVGELILRLFGLYDDKTAPLTDAICTGLQIVNFWQDLSVDLSNGRCYIPQNILNSYSLSHQNLHDEKNSIILSKCINELFDFTEIFFSTGAELIKYLKPFRLRVEIAASLNGGKALLGKLRKLDIKVIDKRIKLNKFDKFLIVFRSIAQALQF